MSKRTRIAAIAAHAAAGAVWLAAGASPARADLEDDARLCRMFITAYQSGAKPAVDLLAALNPGADDPATKGIERLNSLFAKRRLKVNTDGAGRSYHPLNPRGLADAPAARRPLNNICNGGVRVTNADGERLDCRAASERDEYYANYERVRANRWRPIGKIKVTFNPLILEVKREAMFRGMRYQEPCIAASGTFKGYFVSVTGLQNTSQTKGCNPHRYIDALSVKSAVVPKDWIVGSDADKSVTLADMVFKDVRGPEGYKPDNAPVRKGDLVMLYNPGRKKDGTTFTPKSRMIYAIIGEGGPEGEFGEASVAVGKTLQNQTHAPATLNEAWSLDTGETRIAMLLLPNTARALAGRYTTANIDAQGRAAFAKWGRGSYQKGLDRFRACERVLEAGGVGLF